MTISAVIIVIIIALSSSRKALNFLIVGLLAWSFPLHFLVAVLIMGVVYYLYRLLIGRFSWLKRLF